jgi:hypothetical protein
VDADCPECDGVSEGDSEFVVGEEYADSFIQEQIREINHVFSRGQALR